MANNSTKLQDFIADQAETVDKLMSAQGRPVGTIAIVGGKDIYIISTDNVWIKYSPEQYDPTKTSINVFEKATKILTGTEGQIVTLEGDELVLKDKTPTYDPTKTSIDTFEKSTKILTGSDGQIVTLENSELVLKDVPAQATPSLEKLSDVTITNPVKDAVILYDDTTKTWVNGDAVSIPSLANLSDVSLNNPDDKGLIAFDKASNKWINVQSIPLITAKLAQKGVANIIDIYQDTSIKITYTFDGPALKNYITIENVYSDTILFRFFGSLRTNARQPSNVFHATEESLGYTIQLGEKINKSVSLAGLGFKEVNQYLDITMAVSGGSAAGETFHERYHVVAYPVQYDLNTLVYVDHVRRSGI